MKQRAFLVLLAVCLLFTAIAGCGGGGGSSSGYEFTVCISSEPETIDPALNSAVDGAVMLGHLFEGLIKWADDGSGKTVNAKMVNGQAASYDKKMDGDKAVYTFKLRNDIKWSDGKNVAAEDFVYAWQRLVTPETAADYSYMIDMVLNANEIMAGEKDPSTLGIRAIDAKTLEITLFFDCPYFLEVCAFPATFPVRKDIIEKHGDQWTFNPDSFVSNGPYKMTSWTHNAEIVMEKNKNHYDFANLGPDKITFKLMDDENAIYAGFRSGELEFISSYPLDEIPRLRDSGEMTIADYIGTYYVNFQVKKAPFTDWRVRKAMSLVIDREYIVKNITRTGQTPATGYVPFGIYDQAGPGSDFRRTGGDYYSVNPADYNKNCDEARKLLSDAGFPNGEGFPTVEYVYNTSANHKAIAEALQQMWKNELGINVTLSNEEWGTFLVTRADGKYEIARNGWIGDFNDPISFLDMHASPAGGNNAAQHENPAYDEQIRIAKSTSDPAVRYKAMHAAEDILMNEAVVAPIYYYVNTWMIKPDVKGMFYTPLGYMFFSYIKK